ncbi:MAG: ribose-phosphate diphosphokinase [Candidatus Lokiarchaeota archaeon]|nr:ribose-phosphate diphosphokinase [Candidatus Lokiarchaeota archaeon]
MYNKNKVRLKLIILPGPSSQILGVKVANLIKGAEIAEISFKKFPDGEEYIRIKNDVENDDVLVIQTTFPDQNKCLMQLFFILDALKDLKPKSISIVLPYLAYSRQDKRFKKGEALSVKVISTIIKTICGKLLKKVITFDIHSIKILDFFNGTAKNISAMELFGKYFKDKKITNVFCLAPDKSATPRAKKIAKILECDFSYLEKERDLTTGEIETSVKNLDVKNMNVIIADDIISTGGTMVNAIEILKKQGAKDIYVCSTHTLLIKDSKFRMYRAGAKDIIGTDTTINECSKISVAPLIAREFK